MSSDSWIYAKCLRTSGSAEKGSEYILQSGVAHMN